MSGTDCRRWGPCVVCGRRCHSKYERCREHAPRRGGGAEGAAALPFDDLQFLLDQGTGLEELAQRARCRPDAVVRRLARRGIPVPSGWWHRARIESERLREAS